MSEEEKCVYLNPMPMTTLSGDTDDKLSFIIRPTYEFMHPLDRNTCTMSHFYNGYHKNCSKFEKKFP